MAVRADTRAAPSDLVIEANAMFFSILTQQKDFPANNSNWCRYFRLRNKFYSLLGPVRSLVVGVKYGFNVPIFP